MHSFFSLAFPALAINIVLFIQLDAALALYTNSSAATQSSTASSSSSTDYFAAYSISNWTLPKYYNTKSYWIGSTTKQYPIHDDSVTAQPRVGSEAQQLTEVLQCWSSIITWRNESASFRNARIANRTWPVTSFWSSATKTWSLSSTIYPIDASTYKLCDGTPRVDVRPKTTHMNGNTTLWGTYTSTMTPTFSSQPCSLSPGDCRLLYHDTDALIQNENELLDQCGNPAHLGEDPQCLIGGGPVELIYFPVEANNASLCNNKTMGGIAKPMVPGLSEITTLGRTFTSESVYLSFKQLYATYDGFFGDYIGQTFSDLIVPLHSTEVSTQCGGWKQAFGAGTQINYADLNWPVPASAYSCQQRCSLALTSSATLMPPENILMWNIETVSPGTECDTIWSDVNPVLAVPTKIRQMVPQWSSCSFWDANLANFWFDPPIALRPAEAMATPTAPTSLQTMPAAAASTLTSPTASSTRAPFPVAESSSRPTQEDPVSTDTSPSTVEDPTNTSVYLSSTTNAAPKGDPVQADSGAVFTSKFQEAISTDLGSASTDAAASVPPALSVLTEALSTDDPEASPKHTDSAGADSALAGPSSSRSIGNIIASVIGLIPESQSTSAGNGHEQPATNQPPGSAASSAPDSVTAAFSYDPLSFDNADATAAATSYQELVGAGTSVGTSLSFVDGDLTFTFTASGISSKPQAIVVGSQAIPTGSVETVLGQTITHGSAGLALVPDSQATDTVARSESVLAINDLTLTVNSYSAASQSNAVSIQGIILSPGGPAATISGEVITKATDGLLLAGTTTQPFTLAAPITETSAAASNIIFALGSITITASPDPQFVNGYLVGGTSMAWENTIVVNGATVTAGWAGLEISGVEMSTVSAGAHSETGRSNGTSTMSLPSVIVVTPSMTSTEPTRSTIRPIPTSSAESAGNLRSSTCWFRIGISLLALLYGGLG